MFNFGRNRLTASSLKFFKQILPQKFLQKTENQENNKDLSYLLTCISYPLYEFFSQRMPALYLLNQCL